MCVENVPAKSGARSLLCSPVRAGHKAAEVSRLDSHSQKSKNHPFPQTPRFHVHAAHPSLLVPFRAKNNLGVGRVDVMRNSIRFSSTRLYLLSCPELLLCQS